MDWGGYFDGNATTPLCPEALEAWLETTGRYWHNPSSPYPAGAAARVRLEASRERLAGMLGCQPAEIIFNSGATEGNNHVFREFARMCPPGRFVACSALEHPSVSLPFRELLGQRGRCIPALPSGKVDLERLGEWVRSGKIHGLSLMAANNVTGVIQPWREVLDLCLRHGVVFHCDAAQWLGKMPLDGLGQCHYLTASAHKFGGPKGCGFVKVPESFGGRPLLLGGVQENGLRAGTEDFPGVAAMVAALEALACKGGDGRDGFEEILAGKLPGLEIVGKGSPRTPQSSLLLMPWHANTRWVAKLAKAGYQVSTGAACSTSKESQDGALQAMGFDRGQTGRALRISGGWWTSAEDWLGLAGAILEVWAALEAEGAPEGLVGLQ